MIQHIYIILIHGYPVQMLYLSETDYQKSQQVAEVLGTCFSHIIYYTINTFSYYYNYKISNLCTCNINQMSEIFVKSYYK